MSNQEVPKHVGIIMDGNRRWARGRGLAVFKGHEEGADHIESIVEHAKTKGIEVISFWAFSTENWKRSKLEVDALMRIFRTILTGPMVTRLIQKDVKIKTIGDMSQFPQDIQDEASRLAVESENNEAILVNLALNYGGREEVVFAVNEALKEGKTELTQEDISSHLYTKGQPEPDLIIRTSGERRHSGFLLWQSRDAEYVYPEVAWPDFNEEEFDKALNDYAQRERRFGK